MFGVLADWFTDRIRDLGMFFDQIVYGFIGTVYELFMYLANLDLFGMSELTLNGATDTSNPIISVASRIYALLGVFMLFKISFSILQYMVDPNAFSDKSKGFGKLVTNTLISLSLVVAVPFIFQLAFQAQRYILDSNLIGNIVMGYSASSSQAADLDIKNENLARDIQFLTFGAFFQVDSNIVPECKDTPVLGTKGMAVTHKEDGTGCIDIISSNEDGGAMENSDIGYFFRTDDTDSRFFSQFSRVVNNKKDGSYYFDYKPLFSTFIGLFIVLLLVSYCFDAAVRLVKLAFLEIIAPIPIISYMDPRQSGSNSMLARWGKECFTTYISLFIRIFVIYLAFYLVSIVTSQLLSNDSSSAVYLNGDVPSGAMAVWVAIFVIVGIFLFAKQVPKILENVLNIKNSGELTINPFKNPIVAGATGMAIGVAGGTVAGVKAGGAAGAPLRGALMGAFTGGRAGMNARQKLSPTVFGDARRQTYKSMTGNELATFNPGQWVLGVGAEQHINEIDDPLKQAYGQLNEANTRLNIASNTSSSIAQSLRSNGINVSDIRTEEGYNAQVRAISSRLAGNDSHLNDARDRLNNAESTLNNARSSSKASAARVENSKRKVQQIKDLISQKQQEAVDTDNFSKSSGGVLFDTETTRMEREKYNQVMQQLNAQLANAQQEMTRNQQQQDIDNQHLIDANKSYDALRREVESYQSMVNNDNALLGLIDNYTASINEENGIREEISMIQKDIETLSDEKRQRKQFFGKDTSPKKSVSDALENVSRRSQNLNSNNNLNNENQNLNNPNNNNLNNRNGL